MNCTDDITVLSSHCYLCFHLVVRHVAMPQDVLFTFFWSTHLVEIGFLPKAPRDYQDIKRVKHAC